MVNFVRRLGKNLPTLLLALILAIAVWISAVTAEDPTLEQPYPTALPIEIVGQDPGMILTSLTPKEVNVKLKAPRSVWDQLSSGAGAIHAAIDLSGLKAGVYTLPIQVYTTLHPAEVTSKSPATVSVVLEKLDSHSFPIKLVLRGETSIGFQAGQSILSQQTTTASGPESLVKQIQGVQVIVDLNRAQENILATLPLQPVDASENVVSGVTLSPGEVTVTLPITQLGGYRNVVVKAVIQGKISNGYRLTSLIVSPPVVTVFSSDPSLVADLPGFVETMPLGLEGAKDDLDVRLALNLPSGVSVVGDQTVLVQVGIAAIESSLTLTNIRLEVIGQDPGLDARLSPETVSIILSGPLPLLDALDPTNLRAVVDLTGLKVGTHQLTPTVISPSTQLKVESILPGTIEVVVVLSPKTTSTTKPTASALPSTTLTPTPTP